MPATPVYIICSPRPLVGKTLIFRKFSLESTTEFSDYRKFNVSTTEDVAPTTVK